MAKVRENWRGEISLERNRRSSGRGIFVVDISEYYCCLIFVLVT